MCYDFTASKKRKVVAKSSARVRRSGGSNALRRTYLIVGAIIVLFVGRYRGSRRCSTPGRSSPPPAAPPTT